MEPPEAKNPTEALDVQRTMAETVAGRQPVSDIYPYFPPAYRIPFVHIGTDKQLFLDNFMLDHLYDVQRVLPTPQRAKESVLPIGTLPWEEHRRVLPQAALFDPDDGQFKLWYTTQLSNDPYGDVDMALCYAEADDPLAWRKPLSEARIPYKEHRATNIVLTDSGHHIALVLNHDQSDPRRKFLMVYNPGERARREGKRVMSIVLASPDGLHWTPVSEDTPYRHHHLSQALWDDAIQKYVIYNQYSHHWNFLYRKRQVGRQESADFIHWSPKEVVLAVDNDPTLPPHLEFHDMSVRKVGGLYIGTATEFMSEPLWNIRNNSAWRDTARTRLALYVSRDGRQWTRAHGPEPWADNRQPGSLDAGFMCFTTAGQLLHDGKTVILYSAIGQKQHWHGRPQPTTMLPEEDFARADREWNAFNAVVGHVATRAKGVGALILREDGWAELKPAYEHGMVLTRQFVFEGDTLRLNADAYGGYVQVEALDPQFTPYAGFAAEDCDPVFSDDPRQIWHTVRWRGSADVRALWNKPVRLRIHLHQASLYAFQFVAAAV